MCYGSFTCSSRVVGGLGSIKLLACSWVLGVDTLSYKQFYKDSVSNLLVPGSLFAHLIPINVDACLQLLCYNEAIRGSSMRAFGELSPTFKHQNGDLTNVKIDKVFGFMSHVASKVASNNHVPESDNRYQEEKQ